MSIHFNHDYHMHQNAYELQKSFEDAGNYGKALQLARSLYKELTEMGEKDEAEPFQGEIARLENNLLTKGASRLLFDEQLRPRAKLIQLLNIVGMDTSDLSEKPIEKINQWAQENLKRVDERWDQQTTKYEPLKSRIRPLLMDLGFVEGAEPHFNQYTGVLIHSALVTTVRLRLHALIEQWKKGVVFKDLYFLTGQLPLPSKPENIEALTNAGTSALKIRKEWVKPEILPKTEAEMIKMVWEQSEIPQQFRDQVKVHFIVAEMKVDQKTGEKTVRPTTDDACAEWLKTNPPKGRYLAVSNAPYMNRQDLVVRTMMPEGYELETMGPGASDNLIMMTFLDELARMIYQVKQASTKIK